MALRIEAKRPQQCERRVFAGYMRELLYSKLASFFTSHDGSQSGEAPNFFLNRLASYILITAEM